MNSFGFQNKKLKREILAIKQQCAKTNADALNQACEALPESQQSAIQACFKASQAKGKRGVRYTNQWIYECLLLRIKSPKGYNHLRKKNILALPSPQTLTRYMKVIKGSYGYQETTFKLLKEKTAHMKPSEIRGKYRITYFLFPLNLYI